MGKNILDTLLGKSNNKASKLKSLANLAISRIAILKNQRRVRCSHARSDVIQLLNHGLQQSALLRVEHVIKEENMLTAFVMMENYFCLVIERVLLIENNWECPEGVKEAISSLIFAASRCAKFPELQQIREIFTSRFGKEFAAQAVELGNKCRVNHKMIEKLSTQPASLKSRLKVLKKIASENGITLHLEDDAPIITKGKLDVNQKQNQLEPIEFDLYDPEVGVIAQDLVEKVRNDDNISKWMNARKKDEYHDYLSYSNDQIGILLDSDGVPKPKNQMDGVVASEGVNHLHKGLGFEKIHPIESCSSESEGEEIIENYNRSHLRNLKQSSNKEGQERTLSASSLESERDNLESERSVISDDNGFKLHCESPKWIPLKSQADLMTCSTEGRRRLGSTHQLNAEYSLYVQHSDKESKPVLMRSRQIRRY